MSSTKLCLFCSGVHVLTLRGQVRHMCFSKLGRLCLSSVSCQVYWIHLVRLSVCLSVRLSVRLKATWFQERNSKFALEFQFQMSYACCLWVWAEAYWFSAMSLSKWPPGGHIGFFGFRTLTLVCLWILSPDFTGTSLVCMGRSLLIFSDVTFNIWFFGIWTL